MKLTERVARKQYGVWCRAFMAAKGGMGKPEPTWEELSDSDDKADQITQLLYLDYADAAIAEIQQFEPPK